MKTPLYEWIESILQIKTGVIAVEGISAVADRSHDAFPLVPTDESEAQDSFEEEPLWIHQTLAVIG